MAPAVFLWGLSSGLSLVQPFPFPPRCPPAPLCWHRAEQAELKAGCLGFPAPSYHFALLRVCFAPSRPSLAPVAADTSSKSGRPSLRECLAPRGLRLLLREDPTAMCGRGTCVRSAPPGLGGTGRSRARRKECTRDGTPALTGRVATSTGCSCGGFLSPPRSAASAAGSGLPPSWLLPLFPSLLQQVTLCVDRAGVRRTW